MSTQLKAVILGVLIVAVVGIFVAPNFIVDSSGDFDVTENPSQVLAKAKEEGKPIFLEFYSEL